MVFEPYRRNTIRIPAATFRVVEKFDVVKDIAPGLLAICIDLS
jgi:hypothetical protein